MILKFLYNLAPSFLKTRLIKRITKKEGGQMYSATLRHLYRTKYGVEIGYGTYGGCFDRSNNIPSGVTFGNWCSIAPKVSIHRANHPIQEFTMHPLLYNPVAGFVDTDTLYRPRLFIGHDVWIGDGTIILPSVTSIGNGAVIGAGSIVTKNVEAYSVVVGNPARKIKMRFTPKVIRDLERSRWWEMDKNALKKELQNLVQLTKNEK